jgi:hypothetical protein
MKNALAIEPHFLASNVSVTEADRESGCRASLESWRLERRSRERPGRNRRLLDGAKALPGSISWQIQGVARQASFRLPKAREIHASQQI